MTAPAVGRGPSSESGLRAVLGELHEAGEAVGGQGQVRAVGDLAVPNQELTGGEGVFGRPLDAVAALAVAVGALV